jgi:hypothetical protein
VSGDGSSAGNSWPQYWQLVAPAVRLANSKPHPGQVNGPLACLSRAGMQEVQEHREGCGIALYQLGIMCPP